MPERKFTSDQLKYARNRILDLLYLFNDHTLPYGRNKYDHGQYLYYWTMDFLNSSPRAQKKVGDKWRKFSSKILRKIPEFKDTLTPLLKYCLVHCDEEGVDATLKTGADINALLTADGMTPMTPLMLAAALRCGSNMVAIVLMNGANINAKRPDGYTALMMAMLYGNQTTVDMLLRAGATPPSADQVAAIAVAALPRRTAVAEGRVRRMPAGSELAAKLRNVNAFKSTLGSIGQLDSRGDEIQELTAANTTIYSPHMKPMDEAMSIGSVQDRIGSYLVGTDRPAFYAASNLPLRSRVPGRVYNPSEQQPWINPVSGDSDYFPTTKQQERALQEPFDALVKNELSRVKGGKRRSIRSLKVKRGTDKYRKTRSKNNRG